MIFVFSFTHDFFIFQFFYSHVLFLNCEESKKQFNVRVFMGKMVCLGLALKYSCGDRVKVGGDIEN